ncbi:hypothetical protein POD33_21015 [Streptomyces moderatus]|nr:hypothetical protein POD33_21015 [Streptomyces moderatus]
MAGTHRDRRPHGIPPRAVRRLRPRGTPSVREVNAVKGGSICFRPLKSPVPEVVPAFAVQPDAPAGGPVVGGLGEGGVVETSRAVLRMEGPSTLIGPPVTYLTA